MNDDRDDIGSPFASAITLFTAPNGIQDSPMFIRAIAGPFRLRVSGGGFVDERSPDPPSRTVAFDVLVCFHTAIKTV